jgi:MoaA/NifB/PqqE/SkfB family radical SAM enzyme
MIEGATPARDGEEPVRQLTRLRRVARILGKIAWGLVDVDHPILAHLIPIRRCNLACAYCNEYDATSLPVPLPALLERVGHLADLGTSAVTLSGGEPLLHPELEAVVKRARRRGMMASLITNGYLLSPERILALNRAGLDHLQISIDNVEPDAVSMKSLRLLEPKLQWLARYADFSVAINSVVGAGVAHPEDALTVARRARELGFWTSLGVIHDGGGQLQPLGPREMAIYRELREHRGWGGTRINSLFQDRLARGVASEWRCRAGGRYLYVDEEGLVHYCSQQRGTPGIPLSRYTREDLRRGYRTRKSCAAFCTVNCVQQVALFDGWRRPQSDGADMPSPEPAGAEGAPDEGLAVG